MKSTLLLILSILLFTSCSKLSDKYNEKTLKEDVEAISKSDSLNGAIVAATIIRYKFASVNMEDMTYQKILDDGLKFKAELDKKEAEEKALAAKAKAEEDAKIAKLSKSAILTVYDKSLDEGEYQKYMSFKVVIENKGNKDIKAMKGAVVFYDLFDKQILGVNITEDSKIIKVGEVYKTEYSTDYNQFIDDNNLWVSKDLKNMKVVWKPEKIIFADDTFIE